MPSKAEVGRYGEQLAAELLQSKGYSLLARNWRYKRAEVDVCHIERYIDIKDDYL